MNLKLHKSTAMNSAGQHINAMTQNEIDKVDELEAQMLTQPQISIETRHTLHGGMYLRTTQILKNTLATGLLIKKPTTLIISGDCTVYIGSDVIRLTGYNVITASANRKQAFFAHENSIVTMSCATNSKTIAEVESELTDYCDRLMSRNKLCDNIAIITGE